MTTPDQKRAGRDAGNDPFFLEITELAQAFFPEWATEAASRTAPHLAKEHENKRLFTDLLCDGSATVIPTAMGECMRSAYTGPYRPVVLAGERGTVPEKGGNSAAQNAFDVMRVRQDFPILSEKLADGRKLVWLDNAATTQKPVCVIDRLGQFYLHENSNVHRGAHELAARSTDAYEDARQKAASFLGASSSENIVFVRGTTEGINLVAQSYVRPQLKAGDEIILSMLEHHANIVPWQQICAETGAQLRVIPVDDRGQLVLTEYEKCFNSRTRFVSVAHVSNVLGTVVPIHEIVAIAHRHHVNVLIDGAQAVSHIPVDVHASDVDFYVFSGHKIFGPTGIGVLYGKSALLNAAMPYQGGGNMIEDVRFERTRYRHAPAKFEAGTGNIAGAVGLGAALDYVQKIGLQPIYQYEHTLLAYGEENLKRVPGLRLIGTAKEKTSVLSFAMEGYDPVYIGQYLSQCGIAVRAGHHCAQPILRRFGLEASVRPSFAFYNTRDELDELVDALLHLK